MNDNHWFCSGSRGSQLQGAAPLDLPALVEIDDQVQSQVQLLCFVVVEIHVRVEVLAVEVLMRTAAEHGRIEDETLKTVICPIKSRNAPRRDQLVQLLV